jgi:hypothetical protein
MALLRQSLRTRHSNTSAKARSIKVEFMPEFAKLSVVTLMLPWGD